MSKQNNDIPRKYKILMTVVPCSLMIIYLFGFPHPEQVKAWRDDMAKKDCTSLANYLVDSKNTPNYTKIASDNVQFVYDTYKQKGCSMAWFP